MRKALNKALSVTGLNTSSSEKRNEWDPLDSDNEVFLHRQLRSAKTGTHFSLRDQLRARRGSLDHTSFHPSPSAPSKRLIYDDSELSSSTHTLVTEPSPDSVRRHSVYPVTDLQDIRRAYYSRENTPVFFSPVPPQQLPPPPPPPQPQNQDSDSDEMAEERNLAPEKFKGVPSEDAEQWLNHLENYCRFKTYDDNKKLNLALVLMTAGAAHWLETLTVADKQTWDAFKAKFCSRYLQPEYVHFRAAKLLFNTKQQPSESADDFLAKIQQLARQINADEQTTRFAALNGLMPHIASFVTQKQPKTMLELLEAARIAEITAPSTFESDMSVAKTLANVEQQLKLMRAEWDGHTASAAGVAPAARAGSPKREQTPPRSRSPRNVHWGKLNSGNLPHNPHPQSGAIQEEEVKVEDVAEVADSVDLEAEGVIVPSINNQDSHRCSSMACQRTVCLSHSTCSKIWYSPAFSVHSFSSSTNQLSINRVSKPAQSASNVPRVAGNHMTQSCARPTIRVAVFAADPDILRGSAEPLLVQPKVQINNDGLARNRTDEIAWQMQMRTLLKIHQEII